MAKTIEVYGTIITLPDPVGQVEDWGYPGDTTQQYWRRPELPAFFDTVEYDKDGNALLNNEQREYALREVKRCKEGFHFLSNGEVTYITGKNYFYLTYWKLEDDNWVEYRSTDRRYFLFLNHYELTPSVLGVIRGKKRREGATSQATSNLVYEAIFFKNSICGLTSKSQTDAKTAFTSMVSFGYRQLPVFLKPKQLNNKDSVTELVFAHKSVTTKDGRGKTIDSDTGHRSKIDFRSPGMNAYDSGRLSRGLFDEGGKWPPEVPFSKFISIVSKTLVKGAKRVGFVELPSTVNELTKSGGEEFKKVWDNANQFKYQRTPNRLVRYFTPAYDGYVGFIDKYGDSVIDAPTEEQYNYLVENFVGAGDLTEEDIKLGAKKYLENKRLPLNGSDLEEEIRMNPFNEEEMFMFAGTRCEFNSVRLKKRIEYLKENPVFLRQIRLTDTTTVTPSIIPGGRDKVERKISYMDDEKGEWLLFEPPGKPNAFNYHNNIVRPTNELGYTVGADTIRIFGAEHGSMATICIFKKSYVINGEEMGNYPVAFYIGRPRIPQHLYDEVIKACLWYGCKANIERSAGDHFSAYFHEKDCDDLLYWTPARNPNKPTGRIQVGTESASPFELAAQLECAKIYFDGNDPLVYNGSIDRVVFPTLLEQALKYDHQARTPFDEMVAFMMALLPALKVQSVQKPVELKPKQLIPTYKIEKYVG